MFDIKYEPEGGEIVEHDTVMVMVDGKLQAICEANPRACDSENSPPEARASACGVARGAEEVTEDDSEIRQ